MARYFLHLSYDGTAYHGWQRQSNSMTVQQRIEEAISTLGHAHHGVNGCGRTDTGVNASSFYAHIDIHAFIDTHKLMYQLNGMLPDDIAIHDIIPVADDAHARFHATEREYTYRVHHRKDPFMVGQSYRYYKPLDIEAMNAACVHLIGKKEFTSFARSGGGQKTDICDLRSAHWEAEGHRSTFKIVANRFLRNMVRSIVGTMLDVGSGKMAPDEIPDIIAKRSRDAAGSSAPAHGLYLSRIDYPYIHPDGN